MIGNPKGMVERQRDQIAAEKLAVLAGERGDASKHALRRENLEEVQLLIASVRKTATVISAQLLTAQNDIADIDADIDGLGDDITALGASITTLTSDLSALSSGLGTVSSDLADAEAAIVALNASIPDLTGALTAKRAVTVPALGSSDAAADPPTDTEFNDLRADVAAIRTALISVKDA